MNWSINHTIPGLIFVFLVFQQSEKSSTLVTNNFSSKMCLWHKVGRSCNTNVINLGNVIVYILYQQKGPLRPGRWPGFCAIMKNMSNALLLKKSPISTVRRPFFSQLFTRKPWHVTSVLNLIFLCCVAFRMRCEKIKVYPIFCGKAKKSI